MLHLNGNDPLFNLIAFLLIGLAIFDLVFLGYMFWRIKRDRMDQDSDKKNRS